MQGWGILLDDGRQLVEPEARGLRDTEQVVHLLGHLVGLDAKRGERARHALDVDGLTKQLARGGHALAHLVEVFAREAQSRVEVLHDVASVGEAAAHARGDALGALLERSKRVARRAGADDDGIAHLVELAADVEQGLSDLGTRQRTGDGAADGHERPLERAQLAEDAAAHGCAALLARSGHLRDERVGEVLLHALNAGHYLDVGVGYGYALSHQSPP